jgi:hypothetical protein
MDNVQICRFKKRYIENLSVRNKDKSLITIFNFISHNLNEDEKFFDKIQFKFVNISIRVK